MAIHPVEISLNLKPVGRPWVRVSVNDKLYDEFQLVKDTNLDITFTGQDSAVLKVEHFNKQDNDPTTAVIVENIGFFGVSDPRFIWAGIYYPDYPQHYENKKPEIPGVGYLGWNGVYRLEFDIPVFTWIHRTLNMGWLYD